MTLYSLPLNSRIKSVVLKLKVGSAQERACGHMGLAQFHEKKKNPILLLTSPPRYSETPWYVLQVGCSHCPVDSTGARYSSPFNINACQSYRQRFGSGDTQAGKNRVAKCHRPMNMPGTQQERN